MADNKNKKYGRMKTVCKQYLSEGKQEKNRKRRMKRHLRKNPDDVAGRVEFEKSHGKADWPLTCQGRRKLKRAKKLAQAAAA